MRNMTESNWASRLLYGAGDDEEGYGYIATDVVDGLQCKICTDTLYKSDINTTIHSTSTSSP